MSRAPYGARGLKSYRKETRAYQQKRRAPYGARGLKLIGGAIGIFGRLVAPRMGRVD